MSDYYEYVGRMNQRWHACDATVLHPSWTIRRLCASIANPVIIIITTTIIIIITIMHAPHSPKLRSLQQS